MKAVKIAELKSRFSHHLRKVRAGESFTVLDRDIPVARLVPVNDQSDVVVTSPASDAPPFQKIRLPHRTDVAVDIVGLLLEDRRRR
jgi:antitoxin (DNA-binding transcriptional repressor) of toxin-antitoxin stability system